MVGGEHDDRKVVGGGHDDVVIIRYLIRSVVDNYMVNFEVPNYEVKSY
jgi:hypothetical protein